MKSLEKLKSLSKVAYRLACRKAQEADRKFAKKVVDVERKLRRDTK